MNKKQVPKIIQFLQTAIRGDATKSSLSKIKAAIFAIVIGFAVGAIPIMASGGDIWLVYTKVFILPFSRLSMRRTITTIVVFLLLGIGIAVSFKTGLFNIGAPGQFLLAGAITVMMGIQFEWTKGLALPVLMVVAACVGAIVAGFTGVLKAFFKVHEVVVTILLNWIIFYFVKYIFDLSAFRNPTNGASFVVHDSMAFSLRLDSYEFLGIIAIGLILALTIWLIFKFTTFGYQMKVNGLNQDAAHYGGMNVKLITIGAMALSGALAGIAGFVFYNTLQGQMPLLDHALPSQGFQAITVALLAFNSPLGAILAATFYGTLTAGIDMTAPLAGIPPETINLVLGLVIFFASIATVLVQLTPITSLHKLWFSYTSPQFAKKRQKNYRLIRQLRQKLATSKTASRQERIKEKTATRAWLKKHDINLRKRFDHTPYIEFIQTNHHQNELYQYYQHVWAQKIKQINHQHHKKTITLIVRDAQYLETNNYYRQLIHDQKLNANILFKQFTKSQMIEIRNKFKLQLQTGFASRKKWVARKEHH